MTDQEFILWASKMVQSFDPKTQDRVQIKELKPINNRVRTANFKSVDFNSKEGLYVWNLHYIDLNYLPIDQIFFTVNDGVISLNAVKNKTNIQKATVNDVRHWDGIVCFEIETYENYFIVRSEDNKTYKELVNSYVKRQPINICIPNPTQPAGEGAKQ